MPPWQPEPGYGEFRHSRSLSDAQIALFAQWVKDGTPEGDPDKIPPLPSFPETWQLGKPDLEVRMDRVFKVPATGPDIYQNFVFPLGLAEDKWVTAVEFRATAPSVIHHVLYFVDDSGRARAQASQEGQPGFPGMGFRATGGLGGWAVGDTPVKLPDGLAYPLAKDSDLVLQTHFNPSGKAEEELITVGLYFADEPPQRTFVNLHLPPLFGLFSGIDIPAGAPNFAISDSFRLPVDVDLVGVRSHAHRLCKTMKAEAQLPSGEQEKLFFIKNWDFNWQGQYFYQDYVRLPKGSVIRSSLTWDNSAANPWNSADPVRVRWGESSADEMGTISFLTLAADEADTPKLKDALQTHVRHTVVKASLVPAGVMLLAAGCASAVLCWWLACRRQITNGRTIMSHALIGGIILGGIGLGAGYFGPILFAPGANEGPLLGVIVTGPLGIVIGVVLGVVVGLSRSQPISSATKLPVSGFWQRFTWSMACLLIGGGLSSLLPILLMDAGVPVKQPNEQFAGLILFIVWMYAGLISGLTGLLSGAIRPGKQALTQTLACLMATDVLALVYLGSGFAFLYAASISIKACGMIVQNYNAFPTTWTIPHLKAQAPA
ncbi:MAG: hypothetical protein U0872_04780 [Planctomycetaceae bacterium]